MAARFVPTQLEPTETIYINYLFFAGFAIASALVTLGNPRTVSLDPPPKSESKSKSRKAVSSQHPESCV